MKRKLIAAIGVVGMVVSIAACGSDNKDSGGKAGAEGYKGQTLTVWTMSGSNPPEWTKQVKAEFEEKTKAKLDIQVQEWNGIQQKITTALSETNPPDVLEIGNTQTPAYAKTGGLADLTDLKKEIGADWTDAVNKPSVYDGKQYALPWYFGNRTVMYNKKIFKQAGITKTPKTRQELFDDFKKIGRKTDAEPLYLPGQNWYFFDGLLVGQGVEPVKKDGDTWVSNLSDPKVAKAMEIYKQYQAFSKAPKDKDEATPQQATVFGKGNTGAIIAMGYEAGTALQSKKLKAEDVGFFTIPGETADKPEGVFLGGSNFAVAAGGEKRDLAKEFLRIALSVKNDGQLIKETGWTPKSPALEPYAKNQPAAEAGAPAAAESGGTTPLIPQWAPVENPPNPIKTYMTAVLNGTAPAAAAKQVEGELDKRLSQQQ